MCPYAIRFLQVKAPANVAWTSLELALRPNRVELSDRLQTLKKREVRREKTKRRDQVPNR